MTVKITDEELRYLLTCRDVAQKLATFNRLKAARHDNTIEQAASNLNRSRQFEAIARA